LVWSPRGLPTRGVWHLDGPFLPIEFSRVSSGGVVTLVIDDSAVWMRSLWVQMSSKSIADSVRALADREGVTSSDDSVLPSQIAFWSQDKSTGQKEAAIIGEFARRVGLDAVVWTALKPGMDKDSRGIAPAAQDLVDHLKELPQHAFQKAEAYVRNAPITVDTTNRRLFAEVFGWFPSDTAYTACGLTRACNGHQILSSDSTS